MSVTRFERHLLFTTAVILGTLLGHMTCGRAPKLSIKSNNYSSTRSWAFFLLPGSMLGWVGSRTKQNTQYQSAQNSNVALVNNVDGQNTYKDQPRGEQHTDKSQVPPLHKDAKLHKNTLLHAVWIIILVVLFIITAIVGIYYWLLFFPILCKKERKYDVMQMSAKP